MNKVKMKNAKFYFFRHYVIHSTEKYLICYIKGMPLSYFYFKSTPTPLYFNVN